MEIADKGTRVGNYTIDTFCFIIVYVVYYIAISAVVDINSENESLLISFALFALYFIYYFVFEFIIGKTPGKFVTKTKVVTIKGEKLKLKAILIRSVCRLFFIDQFSFVFGQGLHDWVSGTTVVKHYKQVRTNDEI